jgi:hypothetical protein
MIHPMSLPPVGSTLVDLLRLFGLTLVAFWFIELVAILVVGLIVFLVRSLQHGATRDDQYAGPNADPSDLGFGV